MDRYTKKLIEIKSWIDSIEENITDSPKHKLFKIKFDIYKKDFEELFKNYDENDPNIFEINFFYVEIRNLKNNFINIL